jgi:transcriptional regulatory protein LEU3
MASPGIAKHPSDAMSPLRSLSSATRPSIPSPNVSRVPLSSGASGAVQSTSQTPATTVLGECGSIEPSLPRALGSQVFSGEDIDYYFLKHVLPISGEFYLTNRHRFFEHFHPFMPIVRIRDPNRCYEHGSTLFWTIIMTACRRHAKSPTLLPFLTDMVRKELFASLSTLPISS